VQLGVWRDGRAQTLSAQLAERHDRIPSVIRVEPRIRIPDFSFSLPDVGILRTPRLGINGEDLSGQLGEYFGAPGGEGVLVREVVAGSAAEKAGMKAGDVIIRIEGNRVRSMSDLRDQLREHREKDKISVVILRKGAESTLTVPVDKPTTPDRRRVSARVRL
jgi:S1-C subfamily serine protease